MPSNNKAKSFLYNLIYAFTAQGISLLLSFLMSLIVPKLLGVTEYGYWQLFIFYSNYVGFFHFGLNDGIYLRCGGCKYKELNFSLLGSQFWASVAVQFLIAAGASSYAVFFEDDLSRRYVLIATAFYLLISNTSAYLGFIFQAANHTKIFSLSVMIDKVFFISSVLILLLLKEKHFETFIILYLISKSICLLYCCHMGRKIVFARHLPIKATVQEMGINISVGINLMFSNIAGLLILGVGRFVIDNLWGVETFGKISFSLSLTSFFLLFISQISMVLFPALRQTDEKRLQQFYRLGRDFLGIILAGVLLVYLPMEYLLGLWLPQYHESLVYLALLLPICTFDGKMQMLCCTYLKVLRKERMLLLINLISLGVSVALCLVGAYVLHSLNAIVIFMVVAVGFRSILSDIYLSKLMKIDVMKNIASEVFLVVLFMASTRYLSALQGFVIYLVVYLLYLLLSKNRIKSLIKTIKNYLKPQKDGQKQL